MARHLWTLALCLVVTPGVASDPFQIGVGVAEITPPLGYPMSGYFHERGATGTLDPLVAKAVVFEQGGVKVNGEKVIAPAAEVEIEADPVLLQVGKLKFLKIKGS